MSAERDEWLSKIKEAEREYQAAQFAVDLAKTGAYQLPHICGGGAEMRDLRRAAEMLEGTYVIRLFAEFESALRLYFRSSRRRRPPSKTEDLLNSIASRRSMPDERLRKAHEVRLYRNALVHERVAAVRPMTIAAVRGELCRFLAFLPRDW